MDLEADDRTKPLGEVGVRPLAVPYSGSPSSQERGNIDQATSGIRKFANDGKWFGVHIILCWHRQAMVSSGQVDVLDLLAEVEPKVAAYFEGLPPGEWRPEPGGKTLWVGHLEVEGDCQRRGGPFPGTRRRSPWIWE